MQNSGSIDLGIAPCRMPCRILCRAIGDVLTYVLNRAQVSRPQMRLVVLLVALDDCVGGWILQRCPIGRVTRSNVPKAALRWSVERAGIRVRRLLKYAQEVARQEQCRTGCEWSILDPAGSRRAQNTLARNIRLRPCRTWLRTLGRPPAQEYRLRLKRP